METTFNEKIDRFIDSAWSQIGILSDIEEIHEERDAYFDANGAVDELDAMVKHARTLKSCVDGTKAFASAKRDLLASAKEADEALQNAEFDASQHCAESVDSLVDFLPIARALFA